MNQPIQDFYAHYRAIKIRLGAMPPPKLVVVPEPPQPEPEPVEEVVYVPPHPMRGVLCSSEAKDEIAKILERHGMTWRRAIGPGRTNDLLAVRAEVYIFLKGRGWSYPQIGMLCGGRDHTTVLSSVRRFKAKMEKRNVSVAAD